MLPVVTSCDQVWPDVNINSKALVFAKGVLNFAQIQKKQPLPNSPPQVHLGPDLVEFTQTCWFFLLLRNPCLVFTSYSTTSEFRPIWYVYAPSPAAWWLTCSPGSTTRSRRWRGSRRSWPTSAGRSTSSAASRRRSADTHGRRRCVLRYLTCEKSVRTLHKVVHQNLPYNLFSYTGKVKTQVICDKMRFCFEIELLTKHGEHADWPLWKTETLTSILITVLPLRFPWKQFHSWMEKVGQTSTTHLQLQWKPLIGWPAYKDSSDIGLMIPNILGEFA